LTSSSLYGAASYVYQTTVADPALAVVIDIFNRGLMAANAVALQNVLRMI
jgi:hypothetical protein